MNNDPTVRVMAIHALAYCERLYYLEEVEEIRVADDRVWAGRRLHQELGEDESVVTLQLESDLLGLRGKVDAIRRRDGGHYPIEHKRGKARRDSNGTACAWESDRLQALAYAMLMETNLGYTVCEARIRYHRDNVTVRVALDEEGRADVRQAVARAQELAATAARPPVTEHERRCVRCSLAPVCLPEEARLVAARPQADRRSLVRLFPPDLDRKSVHVTSHRARIGRSGDCLQITHADEKTRVPAREAADVVIHGYAQMTTQALRLCAHEGVPVHIVTQGGRYLGGFSAPVGSPQRRVRQYRGLDSTSARLELARQLIVAKIEQQLRHLLRASRKAQDLRAALDDNLTAMRVAIRGASRSGEAATLMGFEGAAARRYFGGVAELVRPDLDERMRPEGRSRRPPADPFNALLSFGYALLYRDVLSAIWRVGLEPALGFLHEARSAAMPLALDMMELFRVPVVDMAVLGAVNRRTFHPDEHFRAVAGGVWLNDEGRKKMIAIYERRKHEEYRHPAIGYTISYARMMELEVRLLEKEWSGERGLFARLRLR